MPAAKETRSDTARALRDALRAQATRTVVFHSAVAARLGITVTDLSALNMLSMAGPLTPGQLADRLGITRGGAVTTVVDRLEKAGYVRRSRDEEDRRRVRVELVAVRADVAVAPLFGAIGQSLPDDEETLATLLAFVQKLNGALERGTERAAADRG